MRHTVKGQGLGPVSFLTVTRNNYQDMWQTTHKFPYSLRM